MGKWMRALPLSAALFAALAAGTASATPTVPEKAQIEALDNQMMQALALLTCTATTADHITALQTTIAKSGASPQIAQAALRALIVWPRLCGVQRDAIASVDQKISLALAETPPPGAGPYGGLIPPPIGAPPTVNVVKGLATPDYQ
ncbi:MAG: hypothetical protein JO127_00020 [Caulobacteraceae bacterium]|nr:hypothetical protein [Caulobacteraceae bacterium]